jgi:hypothetical protein
VCQRFENESVDVRANEPLIIEEKPGWTNFPGDDLLRIPVEVLVMRPSMRTGTAEYRDQSWLPRSSSPSGALCVLGIKNL